MNSPLDIVFIYTSNFDSRPDPPDDQASGGGAQTEIDADATGNDQWQRHERKQLVGKLGLRLSTT